MRKENILNITDREFNVIREFIAERNVAELTMFICENFNEWSKTVPQELLQQTIDFHKRFQFWGNFEPENNKIELIEKRAFLLKNRWDEIEEFYDALSDHRSKAILVMILENWLSFYYGRILKVKEAYFRPYFDMDLLKVSKDEVFVDLGAWTGDTIEDYIHTYGHKSFKKIYTYEILESNIDILQKKFSMEPKIVIRPVGVCDKKGEMFLAENDTTDACSLANEGKIKIETVTLDEDIKEKISFIKMDIEGAEKKALVGAKKHLEEDCPKLAISIYHSNEDLIEIFRLIRRLQPNYRFYLRYYGHLHLPTDYILICVPMKREISKN